MGVPRPRKVEPFQIVVLLDGVTRRIPGGNACRSQQQDSGGGEVFTMASFGPREKVGQRRGTLGSSGLICGVPEILAEVAAEHEEDLTRCFGRQRQLRGNGLDGGRFILRNAQIGLIRWRLS